MLTFCRLLNIGFFLTSFRSQRFATCKHFIGWCDAELGLKNQNPIYLCVVKEIKREFPSPDGYYKSYKGREDELRNIYPPHLSSPPPVPPTPAPSSTRDGKMKTRITATKFLIEHEY